MVFLNEMSSSWTKPWVHHTVAVFACAFAMYGRASAPAATNPTERLIKERRVSTAMMFPSLSAPGDYPGTVRFDDRILHRGPARRVNHDGRRHGRYKPIG